MWIILFVNIVLIRKIIFHAENYNLKNRIIKKIGSRPRYFGTKKVKKSYFPSYDQRRLSLGCLRFLSDQIGPM